MGTDIIASLIQSGPLGVLVAYLIWHETRSINIQKERTESDKALAAALSGLTVTIQHLEARLK